MPDITHPINAHPHGGGGEYRFDVEETVDAAALGWDDRADFHAVPDHTRVRVPPGEYEVRVQKHSNGGSRNDWQRREHVVIEAADPSDPPVFHTPGDEAGRVCQFRGSHVALRNLAFDNGEHYRGGDIALRARLDDGLLWEGLRVVGWSGTKENGGDWTFYPTVATRGGQGEARRCVKAGPSQFAGHGKSAGAGGAFGDHVGEFWYTGCRIENQGGDGGLYTGKHDGSTNFYRCFFANNDMAVVRMGAGSELRECIVLMDWENAHPDNEVLDPSGVNGVYVSSAEYGKCGGGLYDTDVWIRSTHGNGKAAINVNNSDCPDAIVGCRIRVDVDGIRPLHMGDTETMRLENHEPPARTDTRIEDLHVSGTGDMRGAAVRAVNRHGSSFRGVRVETPNADRVFDVECSRGEADCVAREDVSRGSADRPRDDPAAVLGEVESGSNSSGRSRERTGGRTGRGDGTRAREFAVGPFRVRLDREGVHLDRRG